LNRSWSRKSPPSWESHKNNPGNCRFALGDGNYPGTQSQSPVPIAYLTLELRIEAAHSLKDKRQVLRSVKDRLRHSFNISVAEIDVSDLWQRATLGVVAISDSRDYLEGLMRNVEREVVRLANNAGAEVVDTFLDYLES